MMLLFLKHKELLKNVFTGINTNGYGWEKRCIKIKCTGLLLF